MNQIRTAPCSVSLGTYHQQHKNNSLRASTSIPQLRELDLHREPCLHRRRDSTRVQVSRFFNPDTSSVIVQELKSVIEGASRGNDTSKNNVIISLIRQLQEEQEKRKKPLRSTDINGTWRLLWTTEKESLFILKNAWVFGTKAGQIYQIIDLQQNFLQNVIEFPPGGSFVVDSTITYDSTTEICSFEFTSAKLRAVFSKGKAFEFELPPVGKGQFQTLFVSNTLRIAEDSRGDFLVIEKVGPPKRYSLGSAALVSSQ